MQEGGREQIMSNDKVREYKKFTALLIEIFGNKEREL